MAAERNMYHIAGLTDLEKIRAEAYRHAKGDSRWAPITVNIHHHKYGEVCDGHQHEVFPAGGGDESGVPSPA